jgi:hypothetical protein
MLIGANAERGLLNDQASRGYSSLVAGASDCV